MILCLPEQDAASAPADVVTLHRDAFGGRLQIVCLPDRRRALGFFRELGAVVRMLDRLIDESTHRSFAIGGLFGDWGAVAALRANRKRVDASVWADRVESQVTRFAADRARGPRRLLRRTTALAMKHYERFVIRRSALGLFHGADCFAEYAAFSPSPHLVHNIHLSESARIAPAALAAKVARPAGPLRIVYAGRAHADKGVFDWIETLADAARRGVAFDATWYGDGPELDAARAAVRAVELDARIAFHGALHDRAALMARIGEADLFLFCHKTPESPRCLIEALISGTPIVGYDSNYPRDLIGGHGGGLLTEGAPQALADAVARLAGDRALLGRLVRDAAADGYPFTDTEVFRHRSNLIKAGTASSSHSRDTSLRSVARPPRSAPWAGTPDRARSR
jgi:glycosyltransferase involved in cell wall biosynthesis